MYILTVLHYNTNLHCMVAESQTIKRDISVKHENFQKIHCCIYISSVWSSLDKNFYMYEQMEQIMYITFMCSILTKWKDKYGNYRDLSHVLVLFWLATLA